MKPFFRLIVIFAALFAFAYSVTAQTPAPTQSNMTFNVGASALGAGGTNATPAANITLELNPQFATKGYFSNVSLLSDNAQAPGINWQYYGGGAQLPIPLKIPSSSPLSPLTFYSRGTVGIERIVPSSGPSTSNVGAMVGGGAKWTMQNGMQFKLFEVGIIVSPHAAWGNKVPYFGGSVSYLFGH